MKHIYYKCPPGKHDKEEYYTGCPFCEGGLGYCETCQGAEGTLTTDCCGFKLNDYLLEAIYKGGLDFKNEQWMVKQDGKN